MDPQTLQRLIHLWIPAWDDSIHKARQALGFSLDMRPQETWEWLVAGNHAQLHSLAAQFEDSFLDGFGNHGGWAIGPHATGVLALAAVEGALVVLGRRKGRDLLAVADRVVGRLFAF